MTRTNVSAALLATTNASMAFMMLRMAVRWSCIVKDVLTGVMVAEIYARKMQLSIRVSIRSISNVVAVVVSKLLLLEKMSDIRTLAYMLTIGCRLKNTYTRRYEDVPSVSYMIQEYYQTIKGNYDT